MKEKLHLKSILQAEVKPEKSANLAPGDDKLQPKQS